MNIREVDNLFEIYFGCMRNEYYFLQMLAAFVTPGMDGYGRECVCCVLAKAFKENEEEYFGETGVKLCIYEPAASEDIEIIVSNEEFFRRLNKEYLNYIDEYPEKSIKAKEYLNGIKKVLNL